MKKRILVVIMVVGAALGLTGCNTSFAYTYNVDTGDAVRIELNTTDGYSISSETPFEISKDGEVLSTGTFIYEEYYDAYVEAAETDENAEILDKGNENGIKYVFWNYDDEEYNYVILIKGSDTGILLGNNISEESAKEVFERLEITLE